MALIFAFCTQTSESKSCSLQRTKNSGRGFGLKLKSTCIRNVQRQWESCATWQYSSIGENWARCTQKSTKVQNRPQTFSNSPENTLSLSDIAKNVGYVSEWASGSKHKKRKAEMVQLPHRQFLKPYIIFQFNSLHAMNYLLHIRTHSTNDKKKLGCSLLSFPFKSQMPFTQTLFEILFLVDFEMLKISDTVYRENGCRCRFSMIETLSSILRLWIAAL